MAMSARPPARRRAPRDFPVAIVGSGFSGLCMGIMLKRAGYHDFTILEKADEVGGTWRDNTYPGIACDIPSHLYSFSFEQNPHWSRAYPPQEELLDYLKHCARKYDLYPHIQFNSLVTGADFDTDNATWTVHVDGGEDVTARALVIGTGALHIPAYPDIPGVDDFDGVSFHSARWNHDYDLTGKRVAAIGTGASAIQFVPQIAPAVEHLYLFQRTPPWILPKPDRAISPITQQAFKWIPGLQNSYRALLYWIQEARVLGFIQQRWILEQAEKQALKHMREAIPDKDLRKKLTPDYRMGCKRILISNDYYPSLMRDNVELVTDPIESAGAHSIRTTDGTEREIDTIIFGTGFAATSYLSVLNIRGLDGVELDKVASQFPETYLGITMSGFPNMFLLMGPNTGLGHNSMIFMIEAQARYALQCIQKLDYDNRAWMDVRTPVQDEFNTGLTDQFGRTVWTSGCQSWYMTPDGRHPVLWPHSTVNYWLRTRRVDFSDYTFAPTET